MKRVAASALIVVAALAAYLLLWPVPVQSVAWQAPKAPGYTGPHAANQRLAQLQHLPLAGDVGPEHVVVREEDGPAWVWMAVAGADHKSGRIVRMKPDGSAREVVVDTGRRPLGFDFDRQGALIVADPEAGDHGGVLRITGRGAGSRVEVLTDSVDGGTFNASVLDILEHQSTGRILEYDPAATKTRVLMNGLCFANGVALSADERHLFVAETGEYRIWKIAVDAHNVDARQAQSSDQARVLLANLPGYPDNLMRDQGGRICSGLTKPRGNFIDDNAGKPWLRALALRLPKSMWPVPPAYGHVFAFDGTGKVVADLQDPSGAYPEPTAVTEFGDRLYIQSLNAKTLGLPERRAAGL